MTGPASDWASYRPGEWFGVFGEHATVVLPPSEKGRVARIWAMVDEGAGFDEVLDALIADGLRGLAGFVLVSEDDGETKVVIRGPARAEFTTSDEPVTVEGSSVTTWAERSLRGVRSMRIVVSESVAADDLVIREGLVRVSRVDRPAVGAPVREAEVGDAVTTGDIAAPAPEQAADETAYFPGPQAPAPRPEDSPVASPVLPGPVPVVARLSFSTGEVVDVDRVVVVGRAPQVRQPDPTGQARLVTVQSPHQEISSAHVEIRPGTGADQGSAVVTDLGSTNGTVVRQPGLLPEDLRAGVPVRLVPGAVVDLGDGVTIQVAGP